MGARKPNQDDVSRLKELTDPTRVYTQDAIDDDYLHDEMPEYGRARPDVVVEVISACEVRDVMAYAYQHDIAMTPRGAGTGLCGGAVTIYGGLLISFCKMNRILSIDHDRLTVTVEPGVTLIDLNRALAEHALMYPPDPGEKSATVGGNAMTNAGGMRAVKYGVTRQYIRAMDVVLPDGTYIKTGGHVAKNSSGYSLKDLLIGSEGTLGVVTSLVLAVIPMPKVIISLLVPFPDFATCIQAVPNIIRGGTNPTAIECMQREVIEEAEKYLGKKFPDKSADAYLLLTYDGNDRETVDKTYEMAAHQLLEQGALDVFISDTQERQETIWRARGAFLEAIKSSTPQMDECDVVVPMTHIPQYMAYTRTLEKQFGVRIRSFGHAGDGNLHIYLCRDDMDEKTWHTKRQIIMDRLYEKALQLDGKVSGEHGIGHAKIKYLEKSLDHASLSLMAEIKRVFDPKGLLNPGKVVKPSGFD